MCDNNNTQSIADYLAQLLKDKKQLAAFPNVFLHLERLLDDGKRLFINIFFLDFVNNWLCHFEIVTSFWGLKWYMGSNQIDVIDMSEFQIDL